MSFNPVILVGSCKKNQALGNHDAIRETWGRDSVLPYKIFMGRGCIAQHADEIVLDTPDGYFEQCEKHKLALAWALEQGYDPIFLADDDTFIHTKRLAESYQGEDYKGNTYNTPRPPDLCGVDWEYCHGGCGYWLSAKAAALLIASPRVDETISPAPLDDQLFGKILLDAGITPVHDFNYSMGISYGRTEPSVTPSNNVISVHLSHTMNKYQKEWMHDAYVKSLKVLIACSSCWRDSSNGSHDAIRETWGKKLPAGWDLRFFLGGINPDENFIVPMDSPGPGSIGTLSDDKPNSPKLFTVPLKNDEVVLNVPDGYFYLPWKTTESLRWALDQGYDFILRCFADTYVHPGRLLKSDFYLRDFTGREFVCPPCKSHPNSTHPAPHGGAGYWTSRKAAQIVVDYPEQTHWGEDTHVGFVLAEAGIELFNEGRLFDANLGAPETRPKFTHHLNERAQRWNPQIMRDAHERAGTENCKKCGHNRFFSGLRGPRCRHCGTTNLPIKES
jgi:hypothetical protein